MPFNVKHPNLCLTTCECQPTAPAPECKCTKTSSGDCCLSLCSISAVPKYTDKSCPIYTVNILDQEHNLNACSGETITATIADYNSDDFNSIELIGYDLVWTVDKNSPNEYTEVTLKVECGCYAAYMCVLIKLEKPKFNLNISIEQDLSNKTEYNITIKETENNKSNLKIK